MARPLIVPWAVYGPPLTVWSCDFWGFQKKSKSLEFYRAKCLGQPGLAAGSAMITLTIEYNACWCVIGDVIMQHTCHRPSDKLNVIFIIT